MPTLLPHNRHLLVKKSTTGVDPLVDAVLKKNDDGSESMAASKYECAKAIFLSPVKRNYVDAALMASEDVAEIATLLDFPADIVETYRSFFFDIKGFNRLSKLELIENYEDQGRDLLVWALASGLPFIRWRLGESVSINPIEGLKDMFSLCVFKSKEAMFSSNGSTNSVEAVKWTKLAMDLARLLKMYLLDTGAAKKDIEMALGTIVPEFPSFASFEDTDPS